MWLANEMKINLPLELDFTQEGRNSEKVSRIFRDSCWLKIPEIYWSLTTSRVLGQQLLNYTRNKVYDSSDGVL